MSKAASKLKTVNLNVQVDGKPVYRTVSGLRLGRQRKIFSPKEFLEPLSKGDRRRVRKALHAAGFGGDAFCPRNYSN